MLSLRPKGLRKGGQFKNLSQPACMPLDESITGLLYGALSDKSTCLAGSGAAANHVTKQA